MKILLVRHGFTELSYKQPDEADAVGPPLHGYGKAQARRLGYLLRSEWGIEPAKELAAVSKAQSAQQTACHAGFQNVSVEPCLNEIEVEDWVQYGDMLRARRIHRAGVEAARAVLEQPPPGRVWITHPLMMAALYQVLEVHPSNPNRFTPDSCDIWPIDVPRVRPDHVS